MGMGNNMLGFNLGAYTNTSYKLYSYIDIQIQEVTTLERTKAVSTISSMAWKFPSYSPASSMKNKRPVHQYHLTVLGAANIIGF